MVFVLWLERHKAQETERRYDLSCVNVLIPTQRYLLYVIYFKSLKDSVRFSLYVIWSHRPLWFSSSLHLHAAFIKRNHGQVYHHFILHRISRSSCCSSSSRSQQWLQSSSRWVGRDLTSCNLWKGTGIYHVLLPWRVLQARQVEYVSFYRVP